MPINNNLPPVKGPTDLGFNQPIITKFKDHLVSLNVQLLDAPSIKQLHGYICDFSTATWEDKPLHCGSLSPEEKNKIIYKIFKGELLPGALETMRLTFLIGGIDVITVTHLLRHRLLTFSAQCTADRNQRNDDALVPEPIKNSPEFYERYEKIVLMAKQLYADMIDSKKISVMDARHILPKCLETYYYVSGSIKDIMAFIYQRIDKQIQPTEDNVIAYYMWLRILQQYPFLANIINIHTPASYYVKTCRKGTNSNLYMPDKDSDVFEYNENDFIYPCTRNKLNGTDPINEKTIFEDILEYVDNRIKFFQNYAKEKYPYLYE